MSLLVSKREGFSIAIVWTLWTDSLRVLVIRDICFLCNHTLDDNRGGLSSNCC